MDVATRIAPEFDFTRLVLFHGAGHVASNSSRTGRRHQATRPQDLAQRADSAHHVGCRNGHVKKRAAAVPAPATPLDALPRTPDQLRQLVGRVSLREIVAETTDVIERMCIEAALNLTGNNRASAAEVLGLSRQSLYSKLSRHGVGTPEPDPAPGN